MILDFIVMLIGYLTPLVSVASGFLAVSTPVVTTFSTLMLNVLKWIGFVMAL